MRNLKKALALVLALMMTLSLMVTASAAEKYTDQADIDQGTAVNVMSALGVFNGVGNGQFKPDAPLTRAQAAKIVVYLMNGPEVADQVADLYKDANSFTDVPSNQWFAGPVNYLAAEEVVAGVGSGRFNPNGNISGYAFARMALSALGYDQEKEGFVGSSTWEMNVLTLARRAGLLTGVSISKENISREDAARIALNALTCDTVTNYDANGQRVTSSTNTLAATVYSMKSDVTGAVTAINATAKTFTVSTVAASPVTTTFAGEIDKELLGHVVTVYYDDTKAANKDAYTVDDLSTVVTVSATESSGINAEKFAAKFGAASVSNAAGSLGTISDGVYSAGAPTAPTSTTTAAGTYILYNGALVTFATSTAASTVITTVDAYTKNDTTHSITLQNVTAAGAAGTAAAIDLKGTPSSTLAKVNLYDGIAQGDMVFVTTTKEGTTNVLDLVKLDVAVSNVQLTGKKSDNSEFTFAGQKYGKGGDGYTYTALINPDTATVGEYYDVYLDGDGKVVGVKSYEAAATGIAILQGFTITQKVNANPSATPAVEAKDAVAKVHLAVLTGDDAKATEYKIHLTDAQKAKADYENDAALATELTSGLNAALKLGAGVTTASKGMFVEYVLNDAGEITALRAVSGTTATATGLTAGTMAITADSTAFLGTNTVFVYWDKSSLDNSATYFTGLNAIETVSGKSAGDIVVVKDGDTAKYVYVNQATTPAPVVDQIAYMNSLGYETSLDGTSYVYTYTVYENGAAKELKAKTALTGANIPANLTACKGLVKYTMTDGYLTKIEAVTDNNGATSDRLNKFDDAMTIDRVAGGVALVGGTQYDVSNAKAWLIVIKDGAVTMTETSVVKSDDTSVKPEGTTVDTLFFYGIPGSGDVVVHAVYYVQTSAS